VRFFVFKDGDGWRIQPGNNFIVGVAT